jgi:hypothetical protein
MSDVNGAAAAEAVAARRPLDGLSCRKDRVDRRTVGPRVTVRSRQRCILSGAMRSYYTSLCSLLLQLYRLHLTYYKTLRMQVTERTPRTSHVTQAKVSMVRDEVDRRGNKCRLLTSLFVSLFYLHLRNGRSHSSKRKAKELSNNRLVCLGAYICYRRTKCFCCFDMLDVIKGRR